MPQECFEHLDLHVISNHFGSSKHYKPSEIQEKNTTEDGKLLTILSSHEISNSRCRLLLPFIIVTVMLFEGHDNISH